MSFVVAIDGPAGSGKGTVAKLISEKLGFVNIDTGATFRCIALAMIQRNIKKEEEDKIKELLNHIDINMKPDGTVLLNGIDEGYIVPSINNDTKLKDCLSGLVDNIKDTKIINKNLQEKHNALMKELTELTNLLNDTIECKKEILNSNDASLTKGQKLLSEDDKKVKLVNEKIEVINNLYMEINNFGVNTKSPIL